MRAKFGAYFFGGGGIKSRSGSLFGVIRLGARCFGFGTIFVTARLLFGDVTFFDRGAEPLENMSEPMVPR